MSPCTIPRPRFTASYMPWSSVFTTTRVGKSSAISTVRSAEPPSTSTWSIAIPSEAWLQIERRVSARYRSAFSVGVTMPNVVCRAVVAGRVAVRSSVVDIGREPGSP